MNKLSCLNSPVADKNFFFLGEIIEEQKRVNAHQVTDLTNKDSTIAQQAETINNLNEVIAQMKRSTMTTTTATTTSSTGC